MAEPAAPARYLDLERWPRRASFEYFRRYDKPFFNVCMRVDVAALKAALDGRSSLIVACHWLALHLAREVEPFCWRIEGDRVRIHDAVHASTTVLQDDGAIGFARLAYTPRFADFAGPATAEIARLRQPQPFAPLDADTAVLHFTTLPWLHFTSFSHARNWGREDSIPKIAFGRYDADGPHLWMPLSVEVHHGLMDGLHVGLYVQAFEAALANPAPWLAA